MGSLVQDLKYAARVLFKSRAFTAAAVVVLALGIGANTAIFSVVNAVLLRPIPFQDPARLVYVWHRPPQKSFPGMDIFSVSPANYLDWQSQNHVFEQMAIYGGGGFTLTGSGQPQAVLATRTSGTFWKLLGARPMLGRVYDESDDKPGSHVVVLSFKFWQTQFGADPSIVGRTITLDGVAYDVIGVMPKSFRFSGPPDVYTPIAWTDAQRAVRGNHNYLVIAKLKPHVSIQQAQAEMDTISSQLAKAYPDDDAGWGALVRPMREQMVGEVRPALLVLLGAVVFVLLIACANVANLVLAKTLARQKEIAIRTALGASRTRVLRQIVCETMLVSVAGGGLGLLLANYGTQLIVDVLAGKLPRSIEVRMDGWVLAFALVVSLLTGIVAGLVPALRLTRTDSDLNESLKQAEGRTGTASGGQKMRATLVVAEVALSLMLLIGAGLTLRSLWLLRSVNPGFDPHNLLTFTVGYGGAGKSNDPQQEVNFFQDVQRRIAALPGVQNASVVDSLPLQGGSHQPIQIEGRPIQSFAEQPEVDVRVVSGNYFQTMHIPLLRGRNFSDSDTRNSPGVIVISQSLAHQFWPNEDALGKRLVLSFYPSMTREVVGIVGDVKMNGLDVRDDVPTLYTPLTQLTGTAAKYGGFRAFPLSMAVRTAGDPNSIISAVKNAVSQADSTVAVLEISSMDDLLSESIAQHRLNMMLLGSFAALALLLAAVGIYSVLAYTVRRRVREIGIRMALGAQVPDVLRMLFLEGMRPVAIGLAIGLVGALALARALAMVVYGVTATDPLTYGAVSILLAAVAMAASIVPAYRATQIDPMKTLHDE